MRELLVTAFKKGCGTVLVFLKWIFMAGVVGLFAGAVGCLFNFGIEWATGMREQNGWLLFLLPAGGVAIAFIYKFCGREHDKGTNAVLAAIHNNERITILTAPLIFISSIITHLFGGSAGREGAALQLGGSIGEQVGRWFRLDDKDSRLIVMCGMSGAFSALFGTPVTAAVFSMEVVSVGVMYYAAVVPCIVSAGVGYLLSVWVGLAPTRFTILEFPPLAAVPLLQALALGILCAGLSYLFCYALQAARYGYERFLPNVYLRAAVGGALVIALTLLVGTRDYNGAGGPVIAEAMAGNANPAAFLLKILFTAVTLGAGFKGGEIVPVLFTGSTFGAFAGRLLGMHPSFGGGIGMAALFCGVTNCPISSMLLSMELFGGQGVLFFAVACAASYMLSGYCGLYSEQRIIYSKTKTELRKQEGASHPGNGR